MSNLINTYCKNYRISKNVNQKELGNVKTISSFENGRSTNINHLESYIMLAQELNDLTNFFNGLQGIYNA